jgi:hypothetical protein
VRAGANRRALALLLFLLVLAVCAFSLQGRRQLGRLGGVTDEWIMLGANIAVHGTLGLEDEPWLLRPPGYPAFLAVSLKIAGPPRVVTVAYLDRVEGLVAVAQAATLALASALLFLWLAQTVPLPQAVGAAVFLGLNPLSVALVGLMQYQVLHVLLLVAATWALDRGVAAWPRRLPLALAGVVWGVATLVRPVTLLLPPFVLLLVVLRRPRTGGRGVALATLVFCGGLLSAIAPWTARNYLVSGRLVPVNLQGWANAWAMSLRPMPADPESYRWAQLGDDLLRLQREVTGQPRYDLVTYVRYNAELEAAYRREFLRNLRRQPAVYLGNVVRSVRSLLLDTSTVMIRTFRYIQGTDEPIAQSWFERGRGPDLDARGLARGFALLVAVLGLLSIAGVVLGLRSRESPLLAATLVAGCLVCAHSLTHLEFTYFYVQVPLLACLGFGALGRLRPKRADGDRPRRLRVGVDALTAGLASATLALTALLLRP